eukprot:Skav218525  [mRNA]  locus=scaffold2478:265869:269332:- [translate_table: standard]
MKMIFSTILDWKLQADGYPGEVSGLSKQLRRNVVSWVPIRKIVAGTLEIYKAAECDGVARHVRLWVHEIWRVIGDRLVVNEDRLWMLEQVRSVTKSVFGQGFDEVFKHLEPWQQETWADHDG